MSEVPFVLLVSGSRDWPADLMWFVTSKLIEVIEDRDDWEQPVVVRHGACRRGVDAHIRDECVRLRYEQDPMRADWKRYGRRAGIFRNVAMFEKQPQPDYLLAFHWEQSPGTAHAIREAYRRGIPFERLTEESLRPDIAALDAGDEE